jgi:hypothetical protein
MAVDKYVTENGIEVFHDGSPQERLALLLNPRLRAGPTTEDQKEEAIEAAKEKVDADRRWRQLTALAEEAKREAQELADQSARQFQDLKPEAYRRWLSDTHAEHAESLIGKTETVRATLDAIKADFAASANPMPITSADAGVLQVRLNVFDSSSPEEAVPQIEEAIQREDTPFLIAAGIKLRSWIGHRNVWSGIDAKEIGEKLLEKLDLETWTPDREAGAYAMQKADQAALAWSTLARILANLEKGQEQLEIHRMTGALSPLLEPISD